MPVARRCTGFERLEYGAGIGHRVEIMGAGPTFDNLEAGFRRDGSGVALNRTERQRHSPPADAVHLRPWSSGVSHAFT